MGSDDEALVTLPTRRCGEVTTRAGFFPDTDGDRGGEAWEQLTLPISNASRMGSDEVAGRRER